jgi:hypothetical protein
VKIDQGGKSEMASNPQPQLIPIDEIALTLENWPQKVLHHAGKDVVEYWDGRAAVTFETARRITNEIRTEIAELKASDAAAEAKRKKEFDEQVAAHRRRAEEQYAKQRAAGGRVPWGVEASAPGNEKSWSKAGAGFEEDE